MWGAPPPTSCFSAATFRCSLTTNNFVSFAPVSCAAHTRAPLPCFDKRLGSHFIIRLSLQIAFRVVFLSELLAAQEAAGGMPRFIRLFQIGLMNNKLSFYCRFLVASFLFYLCLRHFGISQLNYCLQLNSCDSIKVLAAWQVGERLARHTKRQPNKSGGCSCRRAH